MTINYKELNRIVPLIHVAVPNIATIVGGHRNICCAGPSQCFFFSHTPSCWVPISICLYLEGAMMGFPHHIPWSGGRGFVIVFFPSPSEMGPLHWWYKANLWRSALAVESPAGLAGPPTANLEKTQGSVTVVKFLGVIQLGEIQVVLEAEIDKVWAYLIPKNVRTVQASVGFGGTGEHLHLIYHNSFILYTL